MSGLGKCPTCGEQLVLFKYNVNYLGKKQEFAGVKCSSKKCDFKSPKYAKEVK